MFDLAEKRLAWIPIKWNGLRPGPDGVAEPCDFEIQVLAEILDADDLLATFGTPSDDHDEKQKALVEQAQKLTNLERFKRVVSDWRNIIIHGKPAEFTDENIEKLLAKAMFGVGFDTSYLKAWSGHPELALKNSEGSSSSGQPGAGGPKQRRKTAARKSRRKPNS